MKLKTFLIAIYGISHMEPFSNINFKNTSAKEIENIIRSLKAKEPHGYDEITTKILKISALLLVFLYHIFLIKL